MEASFCRVHKTHLLPLRPPRPLRARRLVGVVLAAHGPVRVDLVAAERVRMAAPHDEVVVLAARPLEHDHYILRVDHHEPSGPARGLVEDREADLLMSCDGPQGEVVGPNAPGCSARYSQARAQRVQIVAVVDEIVVLEPRRARGAKRLQRLVVARVGDDVAEVLRRRVAVKGLGHARKKAVPVGVDEFERPVVAEQFLQRRGATHFGFLWHSSWL